MGYGEGPILTGAQTVSHSSLGYRTADTTPNDLNFLCFSSRDVTSGQTITQSLDDIGITP